MVLRAPGRRCRRTSTGTSRQRGTMRLPPRSARLRTSLTLRFITLFLVIPVALFIASVVLS
jgi:hypothetical protein